MDPSSSPPLPALPSSPTSTDGSPFVLAKLASPPAADSNAESEADTPVLASTSRRHKADDSDWNKENVPMGESSGLAETPTGKFHSAARGGKSFLQKLSAASSSGSSPALDNLLKRPYTPLSKLDLNQGFTIKRRRQEGGSDQGSSKSVVTSKSAPSFTRSFSETAATLNRKLNIMSACNRADNNDNLTADYARELALPRLLVGLKHTDLPTVDVHTLAKLIRGEFKDKVDSYRIVDARYRYEYEGGHIVGAENFGHWEEEEFFQEFLPKDKPAGITTPKRSKSAPGSPTASVGGGEEDEEAVFKRQIVIFHCEFSSARGPALMKDLRAKDRDANKVNYPALNYPETYLLHNGYKEFYENYPELCDPTAYQPMKDPKFSLEEKTFRKKSKSWTAGGTVARTGSAMGVSRTAGGSSASRLLKM